MYLLNSSNHFFNNLSLDIELKLHLDWPVSTGNSIITPLFLISQFFIHRHTQRIINSIIISMSKSFPLASKKSEKLYTKTQDLRHSKLYLSHSTGIMFIVTSHITLLSSMFRWCTIQHLLKGNIEKENQLFFIHQLWILIIVDFWRHFDYTFQDRNLISKLTLIINRKIKYS